MAAPIEVRFDGGKRFVIRAGVHNLYSDQPRSEGGEDWGPTPTELFVGSVAGCAAYFAAQYLVRHNHSADDLRVEADFALAPSTPSRVAWISLRMAIGGELSAQEQIAIARVVDRCTIKNSLRDPPEITIEYDVRRTSGALTDSQA